MTKIPLERLRPGMLLARPLLTADGSVLLAAGVRLKVSFIKRLRDLGYTAVFVTEPGFEDVVPPDIVNEQTRQEAMRAVQETFFEARGRLAFNSRPILNAARNIVAEVLHNRDVLIHLGDVRGHDDYTFSHSVNVGILCALIGRGAGYAEHQLRELAVGGLLHDVGKIFIPPPVLNKMEPLTPEEMQMIRSHPRDGFDLLRTTPGIPLRAAHMAYQHHELLDGSGYPRGLKGDAIHPFARINAVADVFDALTADRPYRRGATPAQALQAIQEKANTHYDARFIAILRGYIAPYPVGSRVRLNTGEVGVVVAVRRKHLERPRVRIVEAGGKPCTPPYVEVDLARRPDLSITEVEDG